MRKINLDFKRVLLIIFIAIAVLLLLDYQSRKTLLYQVQSQRDLIRQGVVSLQQTEIALQQKLNFANSEVMVEQFAREELGAGQEGDIRIVPISPYDITPTPTPVVVPTQQPVKNWQVWSAVFFDR